MNNGSGPLAWPIRLAAAVLGLYMGIGGVLLSLTGASDFPRLWSAVLEGVVGTLLGIFLLVAAKTGWSPQWPD